jgi:hypothetical protein
MKTVISKLGEKYIQFLDKNNLSNNMESMKLFWNDIYQKITLLKKSYNPTTLLDEYENLKSELEEYGFTVKDGNVFNKYKRFKIG